MAESNMGDMIGGTLNALPIDKMISAPLMAAISAQIQASRAYKDFVETVGLENGKAVMIPFEYQEDVLNEAGEITATRTRRFSVPLLALVSHPNINVDEIDISFEMTIESSESQTSQTEASGGFEAKLGWALFSVKLHGKVSHKSEQTRKTDTRAKYSISIKARRAGPPEGMMRVLDAMVDEAARPRIESTQSADVPPPTNG